MKHSLKLHKPLAFIDLETTGVSTGSDRIVEIAILKLLPDGTSQKMTRRVNPETPIPPSATAVHGITDHDVAFEPIFAELAPGIIDFLEGCDLSGYNVRRFDLPLLQNEFARTGCSFTMDNRHVVDVQTIFHSKVPRDLSAALKYYCSREHTGAHGALADVEATAEIFMAQLERYDDLPRNIPDLERAVHPRNPSWADEDGKFLWDGDYVVISFGKHKGKKIRALLNEDPEYLKWILNGEFHPSTKEIIKQAFKGIFPKPDRKMNED